MQIINKIKMAIYAMFLTNFYGFKLKSNSTHDKKKVLRLEYSQRLLSKLNLEVIVNNKERLPKDGKFLLVSNHRSIIDPLIIEIALKDTNIFGLWIAKQELANSPFFATFVNNAGTILLKRENKSMSDFFKTIKSNVAKGDSIFIFPEGTRNKTKSVISEFKGGTQIIALKNRLPILPVYIKTNADEVLQAALQDNSTTRQITIEIGELIDYKTKTGLEEVYKNAFNLECKVPID